MGMNIENQIPDGNDHLTIQSITEWVSCESPANLQLEYQQHCIRCAECREQVAMISQSTQPDDELDRSTEFQELLRIGEQAAQRVWKEQQKEVQPSPSFLTKLASLEWIKGGWWKVVVPVTALVLLGIGGWWYVSYQLPVKKGQEAMYLAWRDQRSGETRISSFRYAPWIQQRDGSEVVTDRMARERASSLLLNTIYERPSIKAKQALGRFYLADRKFNQAIEQFEAVLKEDPNNAQAHSDLGAALIEKGKTALTSSQPGQSILEAAKALEYLNRALELDSSLLEALFNRALCLQLMKLSGPARDAWQQYLKKDPNSDWAEEARKALTLLEKQEEKTSLGREELYQHFLNAWQAKDDDAVWQVVSQNRNPSDGGIEDKLTEAYLSKLANGKSDEAREALNILSQFGELLKQRTGDCFTADLASYYQRADERSLSLSVSARGLVNKAHAHLKNSEYREAIALFTEARSFFAKAENHCEALLADFRIGSCYVLEPRLEFGETVLLQLSATAENRSYRWLALQSLSALANIKDGRNEFSLAVNDCLRSLTLAESLSDVTAIARVLAQLAGEYRSLNQGNKSLNHLHRGLDLAQTSPLDAAQKWSIYAETGLTLNALSLNNAALLYQQEELRIAIALKRPLLLSRAQTHLGQTYGQLGDQNQAISITESAWKVGEKLGQDKNGRSITARAALQLGHLYRRIGKQEVAIEWYERSLRLYEQLGLPHYQYITRKGELLSWLGMPNDSETAKVLPIVLKLFEDYRGKISGESQRNNFFDHEQGVYDVAIDFEYSRRRDEVRAYEYSEACRARSLLDLLHTDKPTIRQEYGIDLELLPSAKPLTLLEIKEELPSNVQLLQYAVLEDKVLIWLITKDSLRTESATITNQALSEKVRRFRELIAKPSAALNSELQQKASELYGLLIQPIEKDLSPQKVICIIPDKSLQYLPYQSLFSPNGSGFLVEKFSFMYAASASAFVISTKAAHASNRIDKDRLLSIGNPDFNSEEFSHLQALPATAREARSIAKFYPYSRVLIGSEANEKVVRSAMPQAETIHLATHYLTDEHSVMSSRLLLATDKLATSDLDSDGYLQNYEIYRLKFPFTKLVVLSACQTGIEQSFGGEGAFGAARPFIAIGVPLVIASLWPVDSEITADLMIEFHRQRRQLKKSSVQALRQAQLSILHSQNGLNQHPFFWASFSLFGGYSEF